MEQDLTSGLPSYDFWDISRALRTYLVGDRLNLCRAEERLQLRHVEVTDADAPTRSVSRGFSRAQRTYFTRPSLCSFSIFDHAVGMSGTARRG